MECKCHKLPMVTYVRENTPDSISLHWCRVSFDKTPLPLRVKFISARFTDSTGKDYNYPGSYVRITMALREIYSGN